MMDASQSSIENLLLAQGFKRFGLTPLTRPLTIEFYKQWLNQGLHGEMKYLVDHLPQKENPEKVLRQAQSALVVAVDYHPHPAPISPKPLKHLRKALYAQGEDYHIWLRRDLESLCGQLKRIFPGEDFLAMTDSHPVLERDLAQRAGLGWFGKNTCLIDSKHGSLFLIGEIYTTMKLSQTASVHPDQCGKCRRCIDICPTQALGESRKLDSRKCISYLTIESKTTPPIELRPKISDWLFGCDLCQTVCPWNEKVYGAEMKALTSTTLSERAGAIEDLRFILRASNKELTRQFAKSPLGRAGGRGLKRNAIVVAANMGLTELLGDIEAVILRTPELGELGSWAKDKLKST